MCPFVCNACVRLRVTLCSTLCGSATIGSGGDRVCIRIHIIIGHKTFAKLAGTECDERRRRRIVIAEMMSSTPFGGFVFACGLHQCRRQTGGDMRRVSV